MSFMEWLSYIWFGYQSVIGAIIVLFLVILTLGVIACILSFFDDNMLVGNDPEVIKEILKIRAMQLESLKQEQMFRELREQEENRLQNMYSEWNW